MSEATRGDLLQSIAETVVDYRRGEVAPLGPEHVDRWVGQFGQAVQEPMLAEMDHVLKRTYFRRTAVEQFLGRLFTTPSLTGDNPCSFWKNSNFLSIQQRGSSQKEMLGMFDAILKSQCGVHYHECGSPHGPFIYVDDGVFSGNHVRRDLSAWISSGTCQRH